MLDASGILCGGASGTDLVCLPCLTFVAIPGREKNAHRNGEEPATSSSLNSHMVAGHQAALPSCKLLPPANHHSVSTLLYQFGSSLPLPFGLPHAYIPLLPSAETAILLP
jgi:hypothetical protein